MDAGQVAAARGIRGVEGLSGALVPSWTTPAPADGPPSAPEADSSLEAKARQHPEPDSETPPADPSRLVSMVENIKPAPVAMRLAATR